MWMCFFPFAARAFGSVWSLHIHLPPLWKGKFLLWSVSERLLPDPLWRISFWNPIKKWLNWFVCLLDRRIKRGETISISPESKGFHTSPHSWALASGNSTVTLFCDRGKNILAKGVTKEVIRLKHLNQPHALFKDYCLKDTIRFYIPSF